MQYHSLSFAKEGFQVDIVGYGGSTPHGSLRKSTLITQHILRDVPQLSGIPTILRYFIKVIWQTLHLGFCLLLLPKYKYLLVQNPPAIPTLAVAWFVCVLRGSKLIIDWHNYAYTILRLSLGPSHLLVRFSKWYESIFGRLSAANLCVTEAMKEDLKVNWNIKASTLYDTPPEMFHEISVESQHHLFEKLSSLYDEFKSCDIDGEVEETAFTKKDKGCDAVLKTKRPALIVSSTSWTEDEDFGLLFSALQDYESSVQKSERELPDVLCVITGKTHCSSYFLIWEGPQKQHYSEKLSQLSWSHVSFCLPWLEAEDYPLLLASADLGVCLHMSSSGLDLPMKVVDMFGCGLPVCAVDFKALPELVQHGSNGLVFTDSKQLSQQIQTLFSGFPAHQAKLQLLHQNLATFQKRKWHENWKSVVLPMLKEI
ncbi:hypothetical protein ScPMuIL_003862 [Solemya velum]